MDDIRISSLIDGGGRLGDEVDSDGEVGVLAGGDRGLTVRVGGERRDVGQVVGDVVRVQTLDGVPAVVRGEVDVLDLLDLELCAFEAGERDRSLVGRGTGVLLDVLRGVGV